MQARSFSWQALYLRWAGLFSTCLGSLSVIVLFFAFREDVPVIKLSQAIFGIVGIILSYAIGKDILDRVKNKEESADSITNNQARLAFVGTRYTIILAGLIALILIGTVVFFSVSYVERINMVCSGSSIEELMHCAHDLFGLIFA